MKRYMTTAAAAEYLGISRARLYDWVRRSDIPHNRIGQNILFDRQDLDQWVRRHRVDAKAS